MESKHWTHKEDGDYGFVGDIVYAGITDLSVEITARNEDGSYTNYRIVNPRFLDGLQIRETDDTMYAQIMMGEER